MATTHGTESRWSTIAVRPPTLERLNETMPYKTMNKNEFIVELLDNYEESVSNGGS